MKQGKLFTSVAVVVDSICGRDAPICQQILWKNTLVKAKSKMLENWWKIGKMGTKEWHILYEKDQDTLIGQSRIILGQHILIGNGD